MTFYPTDRLALFIDGANLYSAAKGLGFDIDYRKLLEEFRKRGVLVRAYYYTALVENEEYSPIRPLVERCLAKDPRERYAATEDLARDLATVREEPMARARTQTPPVMARGHDEPRAAAPRREDLRRVAHDDRPDRPRCCRPLGRRRARAGHLGDDAARLWRDWRGDAPSAPAGSPASCLNAGSGLE